MRFQGAVIKEQNVTFAIVIVKKHIVDSPSEARRTIAAFRPLFPGLPVVLMAQDHQGVPTYHGRKDLSKFMAGVSLDRVPWKEYEATV